MTGLSLASFFTVEAREYVHFTFGAAARARARWIILAFAAGVLLAALYALYQHRVPGAIVRAIIRAEAFTPDTAKTPAEIGCTGALCRYELRHNITLRRFLHRAGEENDRNPPAGGEKTDDRTAAEADDQTPDDTDSKASREACETISGNRQAPDGTDSEAGLGTRETVSDNGQAPDGAPAEAPATGEPRYYIREEDRYRAEVRYESRGYSLRAFILTAVLTVALAILVIRLLPVFLTFIDKIMG